MVTLVFMAIGIALIVLQTTVRWREFFPGANGYFLFVLHEPGGKFACLVLGRGLSGICVACFSRNTMFFLV